MATALALPTTKTTTTFNDLNQDCLLEIFKRLTVTETFRIIGIFSQHVDDAAFERISFYKNADLTMRHPPDLNAEQLKIIGRNLKTLKLSAGYSIRKSKVLRVLKPFCEGASESKHLEDFTLNYVYFDKDYLECIRLISSTIKVMDLSFCELTDDLLSELLKCCINLSDLTLLGNHSLQGSCLQTVHLPNFRNLKIAVHDTSRFTLKEFIAINPHVYVSLYLNNAAILSA